MIFSCRRCKTTAASENNCVWTNAGPEAGYFFFLLFIDALNCFIFSRTDDKSNFFGLADDPTLARKTIHCPKCCGPEEEYEAVYFKSPASEASMEGIATLCCRDRFHQKTFVESRENDFALRLHEERLRSCVVASKAINIGILISPY